MKQSQLVRRWLGAMAAIVLGLVWLHRLGAGDLSAPPLSVHDAASWLDHRDTAVAAFALLRLVALGFGWYLFLITAFGGAARYLHLTRMTSVIDRLTLPVARGMLGGVALLGAMAAPPPVQPQRSESMIEISSDPTSETSVPSARSEASPMSAASPTSTTAPTTTAPSAVLRDVAVPVGYATLHLLPDVPAAPAAPVAPATGADSWEIQQGDSFWSVANEHLADINGRAVSEREVDSYWRQLVDLNRSRLLNPNDADLLFVGQIIDLPAVAPG